jgi:hypothetical protein
MRTEAEIRAEIEQTRNDLPDAMGSDWSYHQGRISALEWALSSPSPVAGEDEIVEAMAKAIVDAWALANDVDFSWDEMCEAAKEPARFKKISKMHDQAVLEAVAVLAVAHPLIACAARAEADAEIAELRASLAKAEEALEPFANAAFTNDPAVNGNRKACVLYCLEHDIEVARFTLYDLRKARGAE